MSGLVGYASSDEEDEIEQRPAKIARTDANSNSNPLEQVDVTAPLPTQPIVQQPISMPIPDPTPTQDTAPGPTAAPDFVSEGQTPITTPSSPYTANRAVIQNLTMPTHPNFVIPRSPSPPSSPNSQAALAASTKKITRFLDLKRKGVHFNARLNDSSSLRNPSLLPKLMEFVGVSVEESWMSTLGEEEGGVPVQWREDLYVEGLVKENERWKRKRRRGEGEKVEFVGEKGSGSAKGTPTVTRTEVVPGRKEGGRSRFDQR